LAGELELTEEATLEREEDRWRRLLVRRRRLRLRLRRKRRIERGDGHEGREGEKLEIA